MVQRSDCEEAGSIVSSSVGLIVLSDRFSYDDGEYAWIDMAKDKYEIMELKQGSPSEGERSVPVKSAPVVATLVKSAPVVATPVKSTPVVATPVKSTPVVATPVKSTPVESTPITTTPATTTPTPIKRILSPTPYSQAADSSENSSSPARRKTSTFPMKRKRRATTRWSW